MGGCNTLLILAQKGHKLCNMAQIFHSAGLKEFATVPDQLNAQELLATSKGGQLNTPKSHFSRHVVSDAHMSLGCTCGANGMGSVPYHRHTALAPSLLWIRVWRPCEDAVLCHCAGICLLHKAHQHLWIVLEQHHAPLHSVKRYQAPSTDLALGIRESFTQASCYKMNSHPHVRLFPDIQRYARFTSYAPSCLRRDKSPGNRHRPRMLTCRNMQQALT